MKSEFPIFRKNSIIPTLLADKVIILLVVILFTDFVLFPVPILASTVEPETKKTALELEISEGIEFVNNIINNNNNPEFPNKLPKNSEKKIVVKKTGKYEMTAYTSEVAQCDASPCITANGFNVCKHGIEDTVAANFLKFGTKVRIPELYGDRVFIVRDRMNRRYTDRVDIWMKDKKQAIKFGFKVAKIEVLE